MHLKVIQADLIDCSINATIALYTIDFDNGFKQVGVHSGSVLSTSC